METNWIYLVSEGLSNLFYNYPAYLPLSFTVIFPMAPPAPHFPFYIQAVATNCPSLFKKLPTPSFPLNYPYISISNNQRYHQNKTILASFFQ